MFQYIEEYEQQLLGHLLLNNSLIGEISPILETNDFYSTKHKIIFESIINMDQSAIPVDVCTIHKYLEKDDKLRLAGTSSYITYLTEISISGIDLSHYIQEIKSASGKRKLWELCHKVAESIEKNEPLETIKGNLTNLSDITISGTAENPLKPTSAPDLDEVPMPESIWGDILFPGFITQLNAEPGVGKSTFAYNIAAHGALNEDFLDITFSRRIKTLYVDLETPKSLCKTKIKLICGTLPHDFYILSSLDLKSDYSDLVQLCKKEKYDLVVLDTQSRAFNMEQENDNSEANLLMGLLRQITIQTNIAVLLLHHTTKGAVNKKVYKGRGASAIAGSADVVVNLELEDSETLLLSVPKSRMLIEHDSMIIRKTGNDRFELVNRSSICLQNTKNEIEKIQDLILSMFPDNSSELKTSEIIRNAESEDFRKRSIEDALGRLNRAGKILKLKQGIYTLPPNTVSADSANPVLCGTAESTDEELLIPGL